MLEKYKYTGKHREGNESLVPAHQIIEGAHFAEDAKLPDRPLSKTERIDSALSPSIAFNEVIADTNADPAQTIRNIDLALKNFDADAFSDEEKAVLSEIVVESSEEIINKSAKGLPANDFTDPILLGSAIDALYELEGDTEDTGPILQGIVTVVENISDASKNADQVVKLTPDEAAAFLKSVKDFEHLPDGHQEKLIVLLDDNLRRVTEANIAYHELRGENTDKKPLPLEKIRTSVDKYHDQQLRRRRAMAKSAGNLGATPAHPFARKRNVA